jgi:Cu+-exporting ATPase
MDRRKFLSRVAVGVTAASAVAGLVKPGPRLATLTAGDKRNVEYRVEGFTCATCAAGLETILLRREGVVQAVANYPSGKVMISYDANLISAAVLKEIITGCGFTAQEAAHPDHRTVAGLMDDTV